MIEEEEKGNTLESKVYRPPRLAPMPYLEDASNARGKMTQRVKEKASRSRLLKDLADQYDERPEEMSAEGTGYGSHRGAGTKEDQDWQDRERFEEENFIRLNFTKNDKKLARKLSKKGALLRFQNEFNACFL